MTTDARIRELDGRGPLRYGAHIYRSTNQTVVPSTATPVVFDTAISDLNAFWSGASATSRLKVPIGGTGLYLVDAMFRWTGTMTTPSSGVRAFDETGTVTTDQLLRSPASATTASFPHTVTGPLALEELWEVELWVQHANVADAALSGSSVAGTSPHFPYLKLWRLTR